YATDCSAVAPPERTGGMATDHCVVIGATGRGLDGTWPKRLGRRRLRLGSASKGCGAAPRCGLAATGPEPDGGTSRRLRRSV
ncbi:hypothetical protein, partial [Streptomyces sp. NPDC001975]